MGVRSQRYSMLVKDGVVKALNIEAPGKFEVSDAQRCWTRRKAAQGLNPAPGLTDGRWAIIAGFAKRLSVNPAQAFDDAQRRSAVQRPDDGPKTDCLAGLIRVRDKLGKRTT